MTTDCHEPATPTLQDEFWGDGTDWPSTTSPLTPSPDPPSAGLATRVGATVRRAWGSLEGAAANADRTHGPSVRTDDDTRTFGEAKGELAEIDDLDAAWDLELEPRTVRRAGVDPLLARIGALAVLVTLAVPVVLGFRSSPDPDSTQIRSETPFVASTAAPLSPVPPADATAAPSADAGTTESERGEISATSPTSAPAAPDSVGQSATTGAASLGAPVSGQDDPASSADTTCDSRYELAAGDYWIRIADGAGVGLADLLAVNDASIDTVLVPGRTICLPAGAATPAPPAPPTPPTMAPTPSTAPPATASRSAAASTVTPTTSVPAPTTTAPARPAAVSAERAVAIIRSVWPDDLEERAIEIAWRESKHQSNVNNWCCYGLFQINWNAHRSWLSSLGVTTASQLYDPTVNATAAYTLYQRSGGFGPWGG